MIDKRGRTSTAIADSTERTKRIFEFIYFSRPDKRVFEENVDKMRRKLGVVPAKNHPVTEDPVIALQDSSNTSALGFSQESGISFELGLIRNHYAGGTFTRPGQTMRDGNVPIKYNPVKGVLRGKCAAVVDDSIVRRSTMKKLVHMTVPRKRTR